MQLIDKILLALLIILLPVGILASRKITGGNEASGTGDERVQQLKKIESLLNELSEESLSPQMSNITQDLPMEIVISSVDYSSDSGLLRLSGTAPTDEMAVMISTVVFEEVDEEANSAVSNIGVLGETVTTEAVMPRDGGAFSYQHIIVDTVGVVELRVEQDRSVETVRYDLTENRRI